MRLVKTAWSTIAIAILAILVGSGANAILIHSQTLGTGQSQSMPSLALTATTNQLVTGTTNLTTVNFPASSGAVTLTMPNVTDTLMGRTTASSWTSVQTSGSLGGTPVTLTAAQCGQAFQMDAATGIVYIMPSTFPPVGCTYDFYATASVTSNAHEIESGNAAHFFQSGPIQLTATATARADVCNGTTHIAYKMTGTTLGGLVGTHIRATIISATVAWLDGINFGSGTLATACNTSN